MVCGALLELKVSGADLGKAVLFPHYLISQVLFPRLYSCFGTEVCNKRHDARGCLCISRSMSKAVEIHNQLEQYCRILSLPFVSCGDELDEVRRSLVYGLFLNAARRYFKFLIWIYSLGSSGNITDEDLWCKF